MEYQLVELPSIPQYTGVHGAMVTPLGPQQRWRGFDSHHEQGYTRQSLFICLSLLTYQYNWVPGYYPTLRVIY